MTSSGAKPSSGTIRVSMVRMARRLLAFALAFVVIGGPVAHDVCEAACAAHPGHSTRNEPVSHHHDLAAGASHAAHHHQVVAEPPGTANVATMIPVPHACDHVDAVMTASREAARAPLSNAVSGGAEVAPVLLRALPLLNIDSRHSPPAQLQATSPLRI